MRLKACKSISTDRVKSLDCDNKAYNFLALLTRLGWMRKIERGGMGDHMGRYVAFSPMPHQRERKGRRRSRKHNANNRKTRTRGTGWQRNLLAVSFRRLSPKNKEKKKTKNTYPHTYACRMKYYRLSWYIYVSLNMHYATQPDEGWQQFNIAWQSIFATPGKGRIVFICLENRVERSSCTGAPLRWKRLGDKERKTRDI